ncbi:GGDEF domain-containing protein [uncultured Methylobacterium sp.]|uniref:GGDEF domain-containing protein n=1 Tax=uncultured Methylobacterium sp. TaxID=157278 RepID=UPI0035CAECFB
MKSACTDPLTGLWNRRHLGDVSQTLWAASAQMPRNVAVVMIDIDCFKAFNDSLGHIEGDLCLRRISACVADAVAGTSGTAVRFGGEEILVLLPDAGLDDARRLAETIRSEIAAAALPHPAIGTDSVVTASFGIAAAIAPPISLSELVSAADAALYAAKHAGRDCIWPLAGTEAAVATSVAA